jgi:hypothetical protein
MMELLDMLMHLNQRTHEGASSAEVYALRDTLNQLLANTPMHVCYVVAEDLRYPRNLEAYWGIVPKPSKESPNG